MQNEKFAYSILEAAEASNSSRTSVYEAIAQGKLIARKNGKRTIILQDDLLRWLNDLPAVASSPSHLPRSVSKAQRRDTETSRRVRAPTSGPKKYIGEPDHDG